jgi:hypothetical protein
MFPARITRIHGILSKHFPNDDKCIVVDDCGVKDISKRNLAFGYNVPMNESHIRPLS